MSEYRPTEYVVDFGDCRSNQFVRLNMALIDQNGAKLQERIVRCRDCKYYGCYDGSTWCSRTYEQVPSGTCDYQTVEPNGFCAWGERNDGKAVE